MQEFKEFLPSYFIQISKRDVIISPKSCISAIFILFVIIRIIFTTFTLTTTFISVNF